MHKHLHTHAHTHTHTRTHTHTQSTHERMHVYITSCFLLCLSPVSWHRVLHRWGFHRTLPPLSFVDSWHQGLPCLTCFTLDVSISIDTIYHHSGCFIVMLNSSSCSIAMDVNFQRSIEEWKESNNYFSKGGEGGGGEKFQLCVCFSVYWWIYARDPCLCLWKYSEHSFAVEQECCKGVTMKRHLFSNLSFFPFCFSFFVLTF